MEEVLSDYFRIRYVSSLVRIFNYLEALGGRCRGYMSQRLGEVLLNSYKKWSSVLKGIDVFKHIDEFIDEINSTSIIRLRSDLYKFLEIVDETGGSAKSIESLALKLYRKIINAGNVSKTMKQFRSKVKALLRKCKSMNNVDCSMLEELYNGLKNSERINSFINNVIEKKTSKIKRSKELPSPR